MFQQAFLSASALALLVGASSAQTNIEGAVYAMSNRADGNTVVAYGRAADGTLTQLGEFATGGLGAAFDGGEGLDPLISAYALIPTEDEKYLLAVNAGSNSVSVLRVEDDYSLTLTDIARSGGVGPNSLTVNGDLVVVSNIDADGVFNGEPDQEGSLNTFLLTDSGELLTSSQAVRVLENRPSAVRFSPDGQFLVVSSINAGSSALASGNADELVVYEVQPSGFLGNAPVGAGSSTLPFNLEGRNLPSAIGFEIVEQGGQQFVVVTEAREFQADGTPPAFDLLQTGSVSTFRLESDGALTGIDLDVLAGNSFFDGERTACWIQFSLDQSTFFVSNALDASISSYSFDMGSIEVIQDIEVTGFGPMTGNPFGTTDGFIDLWASRDGRFLYQLYGLSGLVGVFEVDGANLTLIQEIDGLPESNTQGIVAF